MPYLRPTLTQLRQQAINDIVASAIGLQGVLSRAVLRVLAYAQAGLANGLYGFLDWISLQATPFRATGEFLYAWAALKGVYPLAAAAASGMVPVSGGANILIPAGTSLTSSATLVYTTTAAVTLDGSGNGSLPVVAAVAGAAGNAPIGTAFAFTTPISGVNTTTALTAALTGGADAETDTALRTRMLAVYAAPPHGGAASDYIEWAMAVPGVTRAWINPGDGANAIAVYAMLDTAEAAYGGFPQGANGGAANETRSTPASGDQLTIANFIYPLRPVTALVWVAAPVAMPVNFTVTNLGTNNTAAMQAAITAALTGMFLREGTVGGSIDPNTMALWPAIDASAWYESLAAIPGLTGFGFSAPTAPIVAGTGQLPVLGTVTFQT